jgi:thiamine biosynthesis lipoprotein
LLKRSGLLGIAGAAAPLLGIERAEALWFNRSQYKVSKTRLAMGTYVAMTAIHPSRDQAEEAFGHAFAEITWLGALLSRHNPDSPLAELNRRGVLTDIPDELAQVISSSLHYHACTNGAFDITVKPLIDLYQQRFEAGTTPLESEIEQRLASVGIDGLRVENKRLRLARPGMGVTLDGIAKGYIVDRASETLRRHGIVNHLINAGGDIRTAGSAGRDKAWTIAIQDPDKKGAFPAIIRMGDGAVATSGNYEVFYDKEKLFHHIVDGRSGHSPQLSNSVTVTASSVMEADALSTALFVLEPFRGLELAESRPANECLIIERNGGIARSSKWQS